MPYDKYNADSMWSRNFLSRRTTNLLLLPSRNVFHHSRGSSCYDMSKVRGRKILHD